MEKMMSDLGQLSLLLALGLSIYAVVGSFLGGWLGNRRLAETGQRSSFVVAALVTLSVGALWYQFAINNFNLHYVANNSNRMMAWYYKLGALWGGQEGSLLFWCWLLTLFLLVAVLTNRKENPGLMPYVVGVTSMVVAFFLVINNFVANPFEQIGLERAGTAAVPFTPADGRGLNPLLQYWAMVIHPPILYLGYVGFTIPYAFAMAALMTRQLDDNWLRSARRWMMIPWLFQTVGILLGAKWAYVVLGWGGYWGWDPVENASLMPWLTGTAFLHSIIMQERKGMMKVWNMTLILTTFVLCILGTFLTRSGVVSSVHAFGQSPVGPFFAGFLFFMIAFSLFFLLSRLNDLKSEARFDSLVSRESSFLFNNLVFMATGFAVLWGTLFPVLSDALFAEKRTVGPSFFNTVCIPIGLFILLLTGVGPLLAWRKTSLRSLKKNFLVPSIIGLAAGILCFFLGIRNGYSLICLILCVFVTATILSEFHRGALARSRQGENYLAALFTLTARNPRRYGGYVVHLGMVFLFVGFAGSGFNQETQKEMLPGDQLLLGAYTLRLDGIDDSATVNYEAAIANLSVFQDGRKTAIMHPERRFYKSSEQATTEVALKAGLKEDLYVVLAGFNPENNRAIVHVFVNPLVSWVWIGSLVLVLGTLLALIPERREPAEQKLAVEAESKTLSGVQS
jgi:cytochrome c-type biogenesis protein CcmF